MALRKATQVSQLPTFQSSGGQNERTRSLPRHTFMLLISISAPAPGSTPAAPLSPTFLPGGKFKRHLGAPKGFLNTCPGFSKLTGRSQCCLIHCCSSSASEVCLAKHPLPPPFPSRSKGVFSAVKALLSKGNPTAFMPDFTAGCSF